MVPDESGEFRYRLNSFSGNEANHFFLQSEESFLDLTLVSGVDHAGDGRGFALLDYDRDGWLDIALVSTNAPRFQLYRNKLGEWFGENQRLRLKLIGSQTEGKSDRGRSNRDAIGAKIWITRKSGRRNLIQHQVGEGNVAQNTSWVWIAQPKSDPATEIEVVWPTGRKSNLKLEGAREEIVMKERVEMGPF